MMRRFMATASVVVMVWAFSAPAGAAESRTPLIGVNGFSTLIRLEPGDTGDDVAHLQEALAAGGFYHFEIDGTYGPATTSAARL